MTERWLPVVGYEGSYEVSDLGRVRSVDRIGGGRWGTRRFDGRILSLTTWSRGRLRAALWADNGCVMRQVHHLVLEAFVGPRPEGLEGCHTDDVPDNNRLTNLRWDTSASNQADKVRNGRNHNARKAECPQGHGYTSENTAVRSGKRYCRRCQRDRAREKRLT